MEVLIVFALLLGFEVLLGFGSDGVVVALVEGSFSHCSVAEGIGVAGEEGLCSGLVGFSSRTGMDWGVRSGVLGGGRGVLDVVCEGEVYAKLPGTLGWAGDEFIVLAAVSYIIISICSN